MNLGRYKENIVNKEIKLLKIRLSGKSFGK